MSTDYYRFHLAINTQKSPLLHKIHMDIDNYKIFHLTQRIGLSENDPETLPLAARKMIQGDLEGNGTTMVLW